MKKVQTPFRTSKISNKKFFTAIVTLKKQHMLILPDEVVKAFNVEIGDVAFFESTEKKLKIKFIKNTMFSIVGETDLEKFIKNKKTEFSVLKGNIGHNAITFG